jgi:hypothetical protein
MPIVEQGRRQLPNGQIEFTMWRLGTADEMTGEQSRLLAVSDRVCWCATTTDLGTVVGAA